MTAPAPESIDGAKDTTSWRKRLVELTGAVTAVLSVAIAIAALLGYTRDKQKALDWQYLAKGTVINSAAGSVDKIKIVYDGKDIKQVTTISGRLTNTGDLPITEDRKEIEQTPNLAFDQSQVRVISATVTGRTDIRGKEISGLKATATVRENAVHIDHGLLNPGDSIVVQIVLDGEVADATQLPPMTCRVAGVIDPTTRYPTTRPTEFHPTYFRIGRTFEYAVLIVASLIPPFLVAGFILATTDVVKQFFPSPSRYAEMTAKATDTITLIRRSVARAAPATKVLATGRVGEPSPEWFHDETVVRRHLEDVRDELPQEVQADIPGAAARTVRALRSSLPGATAHEVYMRFLAPLDAQLRTNIESMAMTTGETFEAYIARVTAHINNTVTPKTAHQRWLAVDKSELTAAVVCLILGVATGLILTGSWNLLINTGP